MSGGPPYYQHFWPCEIISSNISTLKTLTIGFEQHAIREYEAVNSLDAYSALGGRISKDCKLAINDLVPCLKHRRMKSRETITSSIENLRLTSFDFDTTLLHAMSSFLDFSKLVSLSLESCAGLPDGLTYWETKTDLPCLRSLTIRTELGGDRMWPALDTFICSLIGLTDLSLLMEGDMEELELEDIFKHHGKTLRSLVVDTRTGPRDNTIETTSTQPHKYVSESYITEISKHCLGLIELGITLDWDAVLFPGSAKDDVFHDIMCFPNLKVLNIRNMPETQDELAVEPMLRGLATTMMDLIRSSPDRRIPLEENGCAVLELKTIALGALTYRDVYVGEKWREANTSLDISTLNQTDDYLQLRVYHVDYCYTVLGKHSPLLTLMTKGCPWDFPPYDDIKILQPYWLR